MNARAQRTIAITFIAVLPILVTLGLTSIYLKASFADFIPSYTGDNNDALHNWREIYTFSQVGFGGGYYTVNEQPAPAAFTHFYAYGPSYPLLYGTIGHLLGWRPNSAPIYNMALLGLTLLAALFLFRFDGRQLIYCALLFITFWPLLFYLPTNMQETPNHALAVALALLFYALIRREGLVSGKFVAAGVLVILFATFVRYTWILAIIPFLVLAARGRSRRVILLALVSAAAISIVVFRLYSQLAAPYPYPPNHPSALLAGLGSSGISALGKAAEAVLDNGFRLFIGRPLELVERILMVVLLVYLGTAILRALRRRGSLYLSQPEVLFHSLNLGMAFVLVILFYGVGAGNDYRFFAAPLLLSLLLMIAFRRFKLVALVILVNAIVAPAFLEAYRSELGPQFTYNVESITAFQSATASSLTYDSQAANAWCNTLLFRLTKKEIFNMHPELMSIPAGIGISFYMDERPDLLALPPRSKYLLLNAEAYQAIRDQLNVRVLANTDIGDLYLNLDADCASQGNPDRVTWP